MNPKFDELKLAGELPSPSGAGMRILSLTRDDHYDTQDLCRIVQSDPALTGRLLKIANSARSAGVEAVTTVEQATMRLGANTVRNVALGFSLMASNRTGICAEFDYDGNWSESVGRAVVAQRLAQSLKGVPPPDAFVTALLSLVGRLGLASVHPQLYGEILLRSDRKPVEVLLNSETERFEINHLEVAQSLLDEWGLPRGHGEAVGGHLAHGKQKGEVANLVGVLWAASTITGFLRSGAHRRFEMLPDLQRVMKALRWNEDAMADRVAEYLDAWGEWADVLQVPAPDPVHFKSALGDARRRHAVREPEIEIEEAEAEAEGPRISRDLDARDGRGVTVLAVDDDPVGLRILVRELEKRGFDVISARNGEEGLRLAMENVPDIVVSDWQMPHLDGVDMVRALRRWGQNEDGKGQDIYVIMLTGNEKEEQLVEAFEAGADDYVVKPMKPRVLAARLRAGLRVVRLQTALAEKNRRLSEGISEKAAEARRLERASLTDPLTGLGNRRAATACLGNEWRIAMEKKVPFCAVMCDIDHFKSVNDTYGHDVGDTVLESTAEVLCGALRSGEQVFRLGGEEFLIVLPRTSAQTGRQVADRLRQKVAENVVEAGDFAKAITISMGVAEWQPAFSTIDELLKAADNAVYDAKHAGRNRVHVAEPVPSA